MSARRPQKCARDAVRQYLGTAAAGFNSTIADMLVVPYPPTSEQIALYLREGESNILAWEACWQIVERYLNNGKPLPKPLAKFVLTEGRNSRSKPAQRGRSRHTNLPRNLLLVEAIQLAITAYLKQARDSGPIQPKTKLNPTRNESSNPISACDIVAECLREINIHLQYDVIAKVWNNRQSD